MNIKWLKPSDRVRIVDQWGPSAQFNPDGLMDHWLGQVMTVREIDHDNVKMEEDIDEYDGNSLPGWNWDGDMIECIIDDAPPASYDYEVSPIAELFMA